MLDWPQLRDRVQRALLADDTPAAYLYAHYLPGRLANSEADVLVHPEWSDARDAVARALIDLTERLRDRSCDRQMAALEKTLGDGVMVGLDAAKRTREAEVYSFMPARAVPVPSDEDLALGRFQDTRTPRRD